MLNLTKVSPELEKALERLFTADSFKELVANTKSATDTGTFRVVITTENLDRYQEVIKLDGWELENYIKNPVVLWGHNHDKIVGVCTKLYKEDGKLIAEGRFAPTELGQEVRALYEAGMLAATSVGFIEKEREGNLITRAELLEFSFVSVPANPHALRLSMERGFKIDELITKGFMTIEKEAETTEPENEPESPEETPEDTEAEEEPESPAEGENEPEKGSEERDFSTRQLSPVIDSLKAAIVALEALDTTEELERDNDELSGEPDDADGRAFLARKRVIQEADTALGEFLAELRSKQKARGI